ncbi:hypothetical protein NQ314_013235 [Rhamnusium bicolor]|uniref:MICOS complex subunit n=1 Tax=Rhamnusium bicolor TaxID=1586634 RepID=A0AAV8X7M4_9CUCU|nr:hypothetical protein NQ314_013235 [Rhamnusium bicolor]
MFASQVIRNCLIPTVAAVVVEVKNKPQQNEENVCSSVCRPSELPIYTPESTNESVKKECKEEESPPGAIEQAFRTTRLTYNKYSEEFKAYKRVGFEHLDRSRENVEGLINYLQEENNTMPKAGAIGIGALAGLIFGLRGGIFKKTLYATTGALGMGAICYPREAAEYSQVGLGEAKKYLTIAYNFVYGVKKDDPPLELPSLPKIPTTFSEAWDSVKSTATSFVSDKEEKIEVEQVIQSPENNVQVKDPLDVITESHSTSLHKSCHCPVGACLHSEESIPPKQSIEGASETSFTHVE